MGTDSGLAWSRNRGRNWRFVRGRDWKAKDQQLDSPPPQKTIAALARRASDAELLSGDHVTCLAEGASGRLWIGLWRNGFNVLNPRTGAIFRSLARPVPILVKKLSPQLPRDYVSSLLPLPGGGMLVGYYGGGIEQWGNLRGDDWPAGQHVPPREPMPNPPIMPRAAAPATSKRLAAEKAALAHAVRLRLIRSGKPRAVALDQDWITQGAWLGRYGTYWAVLCAMDSPNDLVAINGWRTDSGGLSFSGPHTKGRDGIRRWVNWLWGTDPRALELPKTYLNFQWMRGSLKSKQLDRRQSSWDDHGEAYPTTWQGPGLFCPIRVPPGVFVLSFYFDNEDGHADGNRCRDYTITLRRQPRSVPFGYDVKGFDQWPGPVRQRVMNFWGGVWVRFLVRGPGIFTVKIGRNYSFNTIVSAVTADLAERRPPPYFSPLTQAAVALAESYRPPGGGRESGLSKNAIDLGGGMRQTFTRPPDIVIWRRALGSAWSAQTLRRDLASRVAGRAASRWRERVGRQAWLLHRFALSEHELARQGFVTARRIEISLPYYDGRAGIFGFLQIPRYARDQGIYRTDRAATNRLKGVQK